jgi:hypothetical protein
MRDWDPIGVADTPQAQDEYDQYARQLCGVLFDSDLTETGIAAYLARVSDRMGLPPNDAANERAARAIAALRSEFAGAQLLESDDPITTVSRLNIGTRVRVRHDPVHAPTPWPTEPTGTVVYDSADGAFSIVMTRDGPELQYWVSFDEPQCDADGDGPYVSAQVLSRYLELLS